MTGKSKDKAGVCLWIQLCLFFRTAGCRIKWNFTNNKEYVWTDY